MRLRLTTIVSLVALTVACGDDKPASTDTKDTSTQDVSDGETLDAAGCTPLTPVDLEALVFDRQDDVSTSYSLALKVNLGLPAADYLVLQFFNYNERIDNATGTFPLDQAPNDNFGTCPECVALWVDQATPSLPPGKFLFQSSGTLRLDVDPRSKRLIGRLEGVRFAEIALDPLTLSSTFVPDGDCAVLSEPLDFDFRWIPPEWTCADASYHHDDGCDCDCGASDPDCYPPGIESPLVVESSDCAAGERCAYDRCLALCSVGLGGETVERCDAGEVCTLEVPDDICRVEAVDPAALGEACTGGATYCAVSDGVPGGICSWDDARSCRPLCATRSDCGFEQFCYTIVGFGGVAKGYCMDGPPDAWTCDPLQWKDGEVCNCGCGLGDPDCADPNNYAEGCGGARCGPDGACPE